MVLFGKRNFMIRNEAEKVCVGGGAGEKAVGEKNEETEKKVGGTMGKFLAPWFAAHLLLLYS